MSTTNHVRPSRLRAAAAIAALSTVAVTACGSDESAQDRYCEAGESLEASVTALFELDLIAEGTNGLSAALEAVGNDIEELRDAATEATAGDVDALNESFTVVEESVSAAGEDLSEASVTGVVTAIGGVRDAFAAIGDTLADC